MGVRAERLLLATLAGSAVLAILTTQTWVQISSFADWIGRVQQGFGSNDFNGLTSIGDGTAILVGAAAVFGLSYAGLSMPASIAVTVIALAMLGIVGFDIVLAWTGALTAPRYFDEPDPHATWALYLTAVITVAISLAGAFIALAPSEQNHDNEFEEAVEAWA
jgi:hypothetical protein